MNVDIVGSVVDFTLSQKETQFLIDILTSNLNEINNNPTAGQTRFIFATIHEKELGCIGFNTMID